MAGFTVEEEELRTQLNEAQWLINHPDFIERPASVFEFLGPDYLNIEKGVREGVKECLVEIFGDEPNVYNIAQIQEAMFTGAIGIGKTTFASIALPYMVHWVLCLRDPQSYFELLPGTRIAFMQMSTSEKQAKEVLFGDIFARIKHSKWFKDHPHDPKYTSQIRFDKDIWIVPGDSSDTTFEGYNILGGIIDEMDSHKVTEKKDYALDGFNTIRNRITSRFGNRGLLILIGQMKNSTGFAATKYAEFIEDGREGGRYAKHLTIWDSLGWAKFLKPDGTRDSFFFDKKRKCIIDAMMAIFINDSEIVMEIPRVYKKDFEGNPEQALRDHAGIPPMVGDSFISMVDKVEACVEKWITRYDGVRSPVKSNLNRPVFEDWFHALDSVKRAVHVDISYSAAGDALGIAMGHVVGFKESDDEVKPYIVFDCLCRMRPLPGRQIELSDMREVIYHLANERGFNIKTVTFDGFQSTDSIQQMRRKRYKTGYVSVDREVRPYHDLREAIYDERLEFPEFMTIMKNGDTKLVEIAKREILQLIDTGKKIDHPAGGSKDVADAMAAVVYTLMGDRQYRRGMSGSGLHASPAGSIGSLIIPGFGGSAPEFGPRVPGLGDSFRSSAPSVPQGGSLGNFMPSVPNGVRRDEV
jgi:hypothetical protein